MARRTKLQTFEVEVEEALEKAINSDNASNASFEAMLSNDFANHINVDDLIQKITTAEEEILSKNNASTSTSNIHDTAVIDDSVGEQLFGQRPVHELSGGTVRNTLLSTQLFPANDDITAPSKFKLLKQKSSQIYWSTTALSALWATGGAFIAHKLAPAGLSSLANIANFITSPVGLAVAAGTAIPILMTWGFAQLTKRSNELHNIATLMTSAAQRLSEPQYLSEEQAVAVGQAIRKEVAAMNEGIERTLERAIELEAIIQSEVHHLEVAYAENESRLHTLIKELNNERAAILNHADRIRSTITGTKEQLSDEFGLVTSKIVTNIENLTQTISQTLHKQGEDLIEKISYASDGVTNQVIEKLNETTTQIQKKNIGFFHELGKNFDNFSELFDHSEKQLENTFHELTARAEVHIAGITKNIQTATTQALSTVDEKFKILDAAIVDRNSQSLQNFDEKIVQLDERACKLSSKFDNITSKAIESFENRLVNVDLSLKKHSDSIIESFIARSQALEDNAEKLGGFLETHVSQINANLTEKTSDIANVFTNGQNNVFSAVEQSKKILREEIKNIDSAIVDIIEEHSQDFKLQISDQRDIMANMLNDERNKIADTLKHQTDLLTENTANIEKILIDNVQIVNQFAENHVADIVHCTEKLQKVVTESCETTNNALTVHAQNIDIRADALRDSLAINSFSLNEVLADQARTLEQRMNTIHSLIEKSDIHVDMALKQQAGFVENAIINHNKVISETVQHHITNLENHTETLKNTLSQSNGVFFETLETRMESFDEDLENRARQIFERAATLEGTLSEKLGQVCETIEIQTSVFEERSDDLKTSIVLNNQHSQAIQQALESSVDNIRITLENSVNMVTDNMQDNIIKASSALSSTGEKMLSSLHNETDKVQEKLVNVSEKLTLIMADQVEKSETSILSAGSQFISSFADITLKAENVLSESGNRIVSNVEQTIYETGEKVLSSLAKQTAQTSEAFKIAGNNAQTLLNETIHTSAIAIEQLLNERSNVLHQSMQELGNNLGYQIAHVGNRLEEAKNQTTIQIAGHIEQLTGLTDYLNQAAQNTTKSIEHLTQNISEQLSLSTQEAAKKIHKQNENLVNTLTQTNSETVQAMTMVKEDMVSNVSAILEQLNRSIYNIHENSNTLISAVQNIDGQLNETANNFFHHTNQVAENLFSSGKTLQNNVEILQGLSQNTFEKISYITSNFAEHAKTLSETIHVLEQSENTLGATLEQKQQMLSALSNTLVAKSAEVNQLIGHYENVLNLAFERADENARNSTDGLQQSLNQLINEASIRFSNAAEDIRRSANEIRLEFSKINDNLHENVQELPAKTKETTQSIRYALNEQIMALKDLVSAMQNSNCNDELASAKKKIVPPKPIWEQDQNKAKQNKWVSDLLARASREEPLCEEIESALVSSMESAPVLASVQAESRSMSGSLDALAENIVQAVDHDAIVALWNNYRRGQRNIVTERLYTLNGRMIFEAIKKKYASDIDFKRSVNQYTADFEKLLRDMSRNSEDNSLIREYLISATGKVYTMLAHASERIQ
ncbi:hypothetical protein [Bartonella sp. A05]|uniref:hypothetical protein n=1 Tax=Bartonella sp. A05 TaxID=2967261 RepID=UPI0022A947DF|nr:hypothetical protein [Bartonella sp. A05]MCZ2204201.1 hypothetical protein [Bartonella sp. A05]